MTGTTERVQISLHAQNLKNVAGAFKGKSDPYAVVTLVASEPGKAPKLIGKTEVIKNNLSPHWVKTFEIDYNFSQVTRISIVLLDEVRKSGDKKMGSAVFEIGEVLGARGNIKAKKMKTGGTLFCRVVKAPPAGGMLRFQINGKKLKNVDGMFGKSDPFFEVSKLVNVGGGPTWQVVYRSEVINNNLNPSWKAVSISLNDICGNNKDERVTISVKDWEKSGKHESMGTIETSVNGLLNKKRTGGSCELKKKGKSFGTILVVAASITGETSSPTSAMNSVVTAEIIADTPPIVSSVPLPVSQTPMPSAPMDPTIMRPTVTTPNFIDYISGGLELSLSVAVDFTGSNGDPRKPGTLHYIDRIRGSLNDYEKALTSVGSVIGKYDSDQQYQMLGFGAKYGGVIRHCFQLGSSTEVRGIRGMVDAYRNTFKSGLTMSGPTVLTEVINLAAAQARKQQQNKSRLGQQAYQVLLILTDGAVSDVYQTKQAIKAAADSPLSIVIVGIGQEDFSTMQFLDDFAQQEGVRDICQFVEFRRYKHNKMELTQATLDEIPSQVVGYFNKRGIAPLPQVRGSQVNLVAEEWDEEDEIDLNVNVDEEGEITLTGEGLHDETAYGTYNSNTKIHQTAPPQQTAPYNPASAPQPVYGQVPPAQAAQPVYGQTTQPIYGQPPAQTPPFSQPINQPVYGQPVGQPTYGQPVAQPAYGQPVAQQAYGQPVAQQAYGQPVAQQAYGQPVGQQAYGQPSQPIYGQATAAPMLQVNVPPGILPGQQMQVQNPKTGQPMIVTVPPGIPPGGAFHVAY